MAGHGSRCSSNARSSKSSKKSTSSSRSSEKAGSSSFSASASSYFKITIQCPYCKYKIGDPKSMAEPSKKAHRALKDSCKQCGVALINWNDVQQHEIECVYRDRRVPHRHGKLLKAEDFAAATAAAEVAQVVEEEN